MVKKYKILFEPSGNGYQVYTGFDDGEYSALCFIEKESLYEDVRHFQSLGINVFFRREANA